MKKSKFFKVLFVMMTAVVMLFTLTACGDDVEKGTYKLVEASSDGETISADQLKDFGYDGITLEVKDDNKVTLSMNGESSSGEFEGSGDDLKLKIDGDSVNVTYKDGKISFDFDGIKMTFEKK